MPTTGASGSSVVDSADEDDAEPDEGKGSAADDEPGEEDDTATERAVDTVLDVRHDIQTYFLAPGEINHIFVDDLLYNGSEFTIFYGNIHLEPFRTNELEYAVGCRTYGPRRGTVEIEAGYDDIEIRNRRPRVWRAWVATVSKIVGDLCAAGVGVLDSVPGVDARRSDARILDSEVETASDSSTEFRLTPVATVWLPRWLDGPWTVQAKATMYLRADSAEELIGTVTFSAFSLQSDTRWETRPPRRQHRTNLLDYNIEYGEGYADPALPVVLTLAGPANDPPELRVDWVVDARPPRTGDQRGLAVTDCEYRERDHAAVGTIRNENSVDVTVFVIAHFYASEGTVLTTPYEEVTVEADSEGSFHIGSGLSPNHRERITECSVVLSNAL